MRIQAELDQAWAEHQETYNRMTSAERIRIAGELRKQAVGRDFLDVLVQTAFVDLGLRNLRRDEDELGDEMDKFMDEQSPGWDQG